MAEFLGGKGRAISSADAAKPGRIMSTEERARAFSKKAHSVFEHTMETITQESTNRIVSTDTARVKWMTDGVELMKFGQYGFPKAHLFRVNGASRLQWGSKHDHNVELSQVGHTTPHTNTPPRTTNLVKPSSRPSPQLAPRPSPTLSPPQVQSISRGMETKRFRRHKKKYPHLEQFALSIVYFNRDTWPAKLKTLDVAFIFPIDVLSGGDNGTAEFQHLVAAFEQMVGDTTAQCENLEAKLGRPQVVPTDRVVGGGGGSATTEATSPPDSKKSLHSTVVTPFLNKSVTVTGTSRDDLNGLHGLCTAFDSQSGRVGHG